MTLKTADPPLPNNKLVPKKSNESSKTRQLNILRKKIKNRSLDILQEDPTIRLACYKRIAKHLLQIDQHMPLQIPKQQQDLS